MNANRHAARYISTGLAIFAVMLLGSGCRYDRTDVIDAESALVQAGYEIELPIGPMDESYLTQLRERAESSEVVRRVLLTSKYKLIYVLKKDERGAHVLEYPTEDHAEVAAKYYRLIQSGNIEGEPDDDERLQRTGRFVVDAEPPLL